MLSATKRSQKVMHTGLKRVAATTAQSSLAFSSSASSSPPHYDVVVAGGGVMGFSAAYHLASTSNLSVAVVERDNSYKYASAMLSCGGIRHQFSRPENVLMSMYGTEFLRSIPTRLKVDGKDAPDIQFVQGGYLFLASDKNLQILYDNHQAQLSVGAEVELLKPDELNRRFPWLSTEGVAEASLGMANAGWFDPWSFLGAMKRKCVSLGVQVYDGEVKHFDMGGQNQIEKVHFEQKDSATGETRFQTIGTTHVVNAAGAWASKITEACGSHDYPVKPRKRSMFCYHCPHEDVWKGEAASPLVVDPSGVYFRREGSGGQFVCGFSPDEEFDPDGVSVEELDFPDHAMWEEMIWPTIANRVKKFEDIKLVSAWAGFYDYNTFDQNAIIGLHPDVPNLYLMNGFSGHGLQQSPAAGRAISELILHGEYKTIDASVFDFQRVRNNEPFFEQAIV